MSERDIKVMRRQEEERREKEATKVETAVETVGAEE